MVGTAGLVEQDGAGVRPFAGAPQKVFEPQIAKHHGRIFKLMGDGALAGFGSVIDAASVQRAIDVGAAKWTLERG